MPSAETDSSRGNPTDIMRMTVYFQQGEWDALRVQADKDDTTMATLVRKAVRNHLKLK